MSDATVVRTTEAAFDAALPALVEQFTKAKANANHILAPFIEGPPGIGKTEITVQLAQQLGIKEILVVSCGVIDTNLEFIGLPEIIREAVQVAADPASEGVVVAVKSIDADTGAEKLLDSGSPEKIITKWIKPERLARFDTLKEDERGLLIFDDTHFLLERQQAMMMQLLTNNRTIHTHKIGNGSNVGVMFLGNRMDDNAGAQEMLAPVIDRIKRIVIDIEPTAQTKSWCAWAEDHDVHPSIIGYLRSNPEMIYTFKPDSEMAASDDTQKFASPRGWKALSDEIKALERFERSNAEDNKILYEALPKAPPEIQQRLQEASKVWLTQQLANYASGTVGTRAGREYSAYFSVYQKYPLEPYVNGQRSLKDIPKEELSVAMVRFASALAKAMHQLDIQILDESVMYVSRNWDKTESLQKLDTPTMTRIRELQTVEELQALSAEERMNYYDLANFSLFSDDGLIQPPANILMQMTAELEDFSDTKLQKLNIKKLLKDKISGTLAGLERPDLEKQLMLQLLFFDKLLRHTREVLPERSAQLNSAFIGGFVAEIDRVRRKEMGASAKNILRESTARQSVNLFITLLLRQSPEILSFLSDRVSISELASNRESQALEAQSATKKTKKSNQTSS